jgi:hypothetical protein
MIDFFYARLASGSRCGWIRLLADGWTFGTPMPEPMIGHHGAYCVLMHRSVNDRASSQDQPSTVR